jgi:hypothetical protein
MQNDVPALQSNQGAMPAPQTGCPERERLLSLFGEAVERYQVATNRLTDLAWALSGDFGDVWEMPEAERGATRAARKAFEAHCLEHGC